MLKNKYNMLVSNVYYYESYVLWIKTFIYNVSPSTIIHVNLLHVKVQCFLQEHESGIRTQKNCINLYSWDWTRCSKCIEFYLTGSFFLEYYKITLSYKSYKKRLKKVAWWNILNFPHQVISLSLCLIIILYCSPIHIPYFEKST